MDIKKINHIFMEWTHLALQIKRHHKKYNTADPKYICWAYWADQIMDDADNPDYDERLFDADDYRYEFIQEMDYKLGHLLEDGLIKDKDYVTYMRNILCNLNMYKYSSVMRDYLIIEDLEIERKNQLKKN